MDDVWGAYTPSHMVQAARLGKMLVWLNEYVIFV